MHHLPAGPPLSARLVGALAREAGRTGRALGHRSARLALGTLVSTVMTALVLAVPVMAGPGGTPSSDSALVLRPDGQPLSSAAFAGPTSAATFSSDTGLWAAATSRAGSPASPATSTGESSATGSLPAETGTPAPAPAPEPAPEPTPEPTPEPSVEAAPAGVPASSAPAAPETSVAAPAPAPVPVAPAADGPEAQVLALVNAERAAAGCAAVTADDELAAVARAHSEDMRDRGYFGHVNPDGLGPFDRAERAGLSARAEDIAVGQQGAAEVMTAWMDSPGHRANILNCDLTRLGTGVATGSGGPWWTQLFA